MIFEPTHLPERQILMVGGEDADDFLSRLLTIDPVAPVTYGALLTPQGKMLCDLFVFRTPQGLALDYPGSLEQGLLKSLMLYRLRAKVTLTPRPDLGIHVQPGDTQPDPRCSSIGSRMVGAMSVSENAASWHSARIRLGLADWSRDLEGLDIFPHEANLDQLHGVSFTKGCYVGQEIVSRMEHRGTARNRIVPVRFESEAPPRGTVALAGAVRLGEVLSHSGRDALALLRLDRLHDAVACGTVPTAHDAPFSVVLPPWWRAAMPGPAR